MYFLTTLIKHSARGILLSITLSSCMLGPNFKPPVAPQTTQFIQGSNPKSTISIKDVSEAGKAQHFLLGKNLPGQWWRVFHSPALNALILTGLRNSPNLAAAKAALIQAQENYLAQVGTLFPVVTGNFSAVRQRFSPNQFGGSSTGPIGARIFNLFNANVSVSYTLDVFGGLRRQVEAAGALVDNQQFELEAAFLTLTSNIVTTAITLASLKAQREATYDLIKLQRKSLDLVNKQFELGGISKADVFLQENQLAQSEAALPPIEQNIAANLHALSVLIGELPREVDLPVFDLKNLHLPKDIPLTCPSLLVRQRPDIRAAEALLHQASAQIGVATANLLPQITLNAMYGQQSQKLSQIFNAQNNIWNMGSAVAQPIFSGGTLIAQRRMAIAAYEQAAAQYKQTVLQAFQNVADSLRALQHDALLLKAQQRAEVTALQSLNLTRQQFRLGGINYLTLLITERLYQQARISRIQAQAARYTDTAALFQALGGGWWNRCALDQDPNLIANVRGYSPVCFGKI